MRSQTSAAIFTLALSLYISAVRAEPAQYRPTFQQLSDANLFEVHLANPDTASHKRLPSDILAATNSRHQPRDDSDDAASENAEASTSDLVDSSLDVNADAEETVEVSSPEVKKRRHFVSEQPSHFIKIRKHARRNLDAVDESHTKWQIPAPLAEILSISSGVQATAAQATLASTAATLIFPSTPSSSTSQVNQATMHPAAEFGKSSKSWWTVPPQLTLAMFKQL